jgi:DNA-binding MarR family transcriptional regulator
MKFLKWLSVADRFAKQYLDYRLAPLGINSSQHMYLLKVCNQPGILQDSFMESFYVHPSNIVRMIATLEKNGFLTRVPYEKDKRTWCLYPTSKALAIADQIQAICNETETILTNGLSDDEQVVFYRSLLHAGKQITEKLNISRAEDEFDE